MQAIRDVIHQCGIGPSVESPKPTFASAAGKAIICGEHAVVYGSRSVAIPLTGYKMQAHLQPLENVAQDHVKIVLGDHAVSDNINGVVRDAFSLFGIEPFPVHIDGRSFLPIGAGLGSSATLCVVIIRCIATSIGAELSSEQVAKAANYLERRFHGKPSGLDTSVVAHEKIISFRSGEAAIALDVQSNWTFALIDSGIRASTINMIKRAAPYFQSAAGDKRIAAFDACAEDVIAGMESGNEGLVAEAMRATGHMLSDAGVVPAEIEEIIAGCHQAGAIAAKVTGAGGGGAVLALLPKETEKASSVIAEIKSNWPERAVFRVELQ